MPWDMAADRLKREELDSLQRAVDIPYFGSSRADVISWFATKAAREGMTEGTTKS